MVFVNKRVGRGTLVGETGDEAASRIERFIGPIDQDIRERLIRRWPESGMRTRARGVHLGWRRNSTPKSRTVRINHRGRTLSAKLPTYVQ